MGDPDYAERLLPVPGGKGLAAEYTLDDLEDMLGYIACGSESHGGHETTAGTRRPFRPPVSDPAVVRRCKLERQRNLTSRAAVGRLHLFLDCGRPQLTCIVIQAIKGDRAVKSLAGVH